MQRKKKQKRTAGHAVTVGTPPGTMAFIGEPKVDTARIDVIHYDQSTLHEQKDFSVARCLGLFTSPGVTWINVRGVHDLALVEALGRCRTIHPLTLEDIVNTTHRPKVEEFADYTYIVLKMMVFDERTNQIAVEHLSLILGEGYVMSFVEGEADVFEPVRKRIRLANGRIRMMKSDYLAYALMDAVVDHYFLVMERIGDRIEVLDDQILADPKPSNIQEVHRLKRELLTLRKAVWPLREGVGLLEKSDSPLIHPETRMFLRDLYDNSIQVVDMTETFRDILGGMHEAYLSSISNRLNEIMKILTVIATIFIPLTFIAGVYGMNFEHMPELKWQWGYFLVWGVMLAVAGGLLVFFKRRKWI